MTTYGSFNFPSVHSHCTKTLSWLLQLVMYITAVVSICANNISKTMHLTRNSVETRQPTNAVVRHACQYLIPIYYIMLQQYPEWFKLEVTSIYPA